jgi:hypothetical protein
MFYWFWFVLLWNGLCMIFRGRNWSRAFWISSTSPLLLTWQCIIDDRVDLGGQSWLYLYEGWLGKETGGLVSAGFLPVAMWSQGFLPWSLLKESCTFFTMVSQGSRRPKQKPLILLKMRPGANMVTIPPCCNGRNSYRFWGIDKASQFLMQIYSCLLLSKLTWSLHFPPFHTLFKTYSSLFATPETFHSHSCLSILALAALSV